jgi:glycosyltransferase involved in cell wall biosynthesis
MKKTLALVMVVKNEEKGLEKAILSCRDFIDEIHIAVDSASTDRTLDIACKYTPNVIRFDWCDDFAWARNLAHAKVKTDWILFLDGHEYVKKCEKLEEYLNLTVDGLLTTIEMESGSQFLNPRIYKNGVQFVGAVHEKSLCKDVARYPEFVVKHNRFEGQNMESIKQRDVQRDDQLPRIMGARVKKDKCDVSALFHLTLFYLSKNDYKKGLYYSKMYLKCSNLPDERWYVLFSRSLAFLAQKRYFRAFWTISRAELENSQRWETEKMKGMILFERKKYEKALEHLVNSFNANKENYAYKPIPRDDAGTWNLIGECFFYRAVYSKASLAFQQASERCNNETEKKFFKERAILMKEMSKGRSD